MFFFFWPPFNCVRAACSQSGLVFVACSPCIFSIGCRCKEPWLNVCTLSRISEISLDYLPCFLYEYHSKGGECLLFLKDISILWSSSFKTGYVCSEDSCSWKTRLLRCQFLFSRDSWSVHVNGCPPGGAVRTPIEARRICFRLRSSKMSWKRRRVTLYE